MFLRKRLVPNKPISALLPRFFSSTSTIHPYFNWASRQILLSNPNKGIQVAQFDLAGTLVDEYCIAPYHAFFELFKRRGFILTSAQITGPMGLKKIEHIKQLLQEIQETWKEKYNRYPNEQDATILHEEFNLLLNESLPHYTKMTPHSYHTLAFLRRHQLHFGVTSGYSRIAADLAMSRLSKSFKPEVSTTSDEVKAGTRIAMIHENNRKLMLPSTRMQNVIFFTDACSDVANLRSSESYPWIIGVSGYSTHIGATSLRAAKKMSPEERQEKRRQASQKLRDSGAHCVIPDLSEASLAIVAANKCLAHDGAPTQVDTLNLDYPDYPLEKQRVFAP